MLLLSLKEPLGFSYLKGHRSTHCGHITGDSREHRKSYEWQAEPCGTLETLAWAGQVPRDSPGQGRLPASTSALVCFSTLKPGRDGGKSRTVPRCWGLGTRISFRQLMRPCNGLFSGRVPMHVQGSQGQHSPDR